MNKKKCFIIMGITALLIVIVGIYLNVNRVDNTVSEPDYTSIGSEYQLEDSQNYWSAIGIRDFTATEDGYFFLSTDMDNLMYFDYATKEAVVACAKPECKHKDFMCNAFMWNTPYVIDNIYYHKGYLYYLKYDSGVSVLVRMDSDGSNREEITQVMPSGQDSSTHLVFHGDYAYAYYEYAHYTLNEEYTEVIKRISLKDGSIKNIYEVDGTNITIADVKSYGNKLYFAVWQQVKERSHNSKTLGLYSYDYDTEQIAMISDENISDYCIIGEKGIFAYYVTGQGLYYSDINEHTTKLMIKSDKIYDMCELSYDGNYVFMSNLSYQLNYSEDDRKKKCMVLSTDGNIIKEIACDNVANIYFGDSRCMFAWSSVNPHKYMYIDKSDIQNADEWISFFGKKGKEQAATENGLISY